MFGFLKRKQTDPKKALSDLLGDFSLPSFPAVVLQAMQEIRSDEGSAASVARIIAQDPGVSVKLLKLVNSAGFGSARKTESVQQAVAMLGMSQVESLLLAVGVQSALPSSPAPGFEARTFWTAAARRAEIAAGIATALHPTSRHLSFTASLLQDMAVPLLAHAPALAYGGLLEAWHQGEGDLEELERGSFGFDHAEIATWVCNEWGLPETLAEAIGGHHGDADLSAPAAVRIVAELGEGEPDEDLDALVAAAEAHGLDAERAAALVAEGRDRGDQLAALFAA